MENEIKRINADELLTTVTGNSITDPEIFKWHGLEITVKPRLPLDAMMRFVDSVVKTCFDDDGEYHPELKDFSIKYNIINQYTNIDMPDTSMDKYMIISSCGLVESIVENIRDAKQLGRMVDAIDEKIDALVQSNISAVTRQINDLYSNIQNLTSQLESVFGNVSDEDMVNLFGALINGGIDEEKLMDAYLSKKSQEPDNKVIDISNALPKEAEE